MTLAEVARAVLKRLRDPEADFELQALVGNQTESLWLTRRGQRLLLRVLGAGGGELGWEESAFRDLDPDRVFSQLAERIDLVTLFVGGPLPDELIGLFIPDESGPAVRYRAEWEGWREFERWLAQPESGSAVSNNKG
ncbi:MAG TPA: hypothetical protein VKI99_10470 [Candidatus Dormibacteraeota bacterium]|nr:hypothetical protein [Candidatus Dormibacteraeota bacterium]